ncbi:MAG: hypothetical protein GY714_10905 [Desulfobacterales bacterium]|nr:hypothetical protein [Desulfobacterales bacterium]MCP4161253.1 hypothetical protein [Deltaproteobacteria bacterium]
MTKRFISDLSGQSQLEKENHGSFNRYGIVVSMDVGVKFCRCILLSVQY